jgi:hypothetical protein
MYSLGGNGRGNPGEPSPSLREVYSRLRGLDILLRAIYCDVAHAWAADGDLDSACENLAHALDALDRLLRDLERFGVSA